MNPEKSRVSPARSRYIKVLPLGMALVYIALLVGSSVWIQKQMRSEFLAKIQLQAESFDLESIRDLRANPADKQTEGFQKKIRKLNALLLANPDFQYAYLFRKIEDKVVFLMDAQNEMFEETAFS